MVGYACRDGVTVTRAVAEQALHGFVFEMGGIFRDGLDYLTCVAVDVWQDRHDILNPDDDLDDPVYPSPEWETVGTVTPTPPRGEAVAAPALPAALVLADSVKSVRETLCVAQAAVAKSRRPDPGVPGHVQRLGRLIAECDRHRPLGTNGKHGSLHTATCGCEGVSEGTSWYEPESVAEVADAFDRGEKHMTSDPRLTRGA
jgi:hypothetical protein